MMTIILGEPDYIRQRKANSCWYACLKMLLKWHEGVGSITDTAVSSLASWTTARSYTEIPVGFLDTHNIRRMDKNFQSIEEIEDSLKEEGPFMGGGTVGKFFVGKRKFGHAILIYGVLPSGHILHHDPTLGKGCKIKGDSYLAKQDGERLHYRRGFGKVEVSAMGS